MKHRGHKVEKVDYVSVREAATWARGSDEWKAWVKEFAEKDPVNYRAYAAKRNHENKAARKAKEAGEHTDNASASYNTLKDDVAVLVGQNVVEAAKPEVVDAAKPEVVEAAKPEVVKVDAVVNRGGDDGVGSSNEESFSEEENDDVNADKEAVKEKDNEVKAEEAKPEEVKAPKPSLFARLKSAAYKLANGFMNKVTAYPYLSLALIAAIGIVAIGGVCVLALQLKALSARIGLTKLASPVTGLLASGYKSFKSTGLYGNLKAVKTLVKSSDMYQSVAGFVSGSKIAQGAATFAGIVAGYFGVKFAVKGVKAVAEKVPYVKEGTNKAYDLAVNNRAVQFVKGKFAKADAKEDCKGGPDCLHKKAEEAANRAALTLG